MLLGPVATRGGVFNGQDRVVAKTDDETDASQTIDVGGGRTGVDESLTTAWTNPKRPAKARYFA